MSEQEPKRVPINLIEAVDHNKPVVEQIQDFERFKEVVNRALGAAGIELVTMANMDVAQSPAVEAEVEPAPKSHVDARLAEVDGFIKLAAQIEDDILLNAEDHEDPMKVLLEYIAARRAEIKAMPIEEQGPDLETIGTSEAELAGRLSEARLMRQEFAAILDDMSAGEEDDPASRVLDFVTVRIETLKTGSSGEQGGREAKRVPINLLEALDKNPPDMDDARIMLGFLDLANRALRAHQVVLVGTPAEEVEPQLSGDLTMEQASQEVLASRLDENEVYSNMVGELVARIMAKPMSAVDVLAELNEKLVDREYKIRHLAKRKPE